MWILRNWCRKYKEVPIARFGIGQGIVNDKLLNAQSISLTVRQRHIRVSRQSGMIITLLKLKSRERKKKKNKPENNRVLVYYGSYNFSFRLYMTALRVYYKILK